MSIKPMEWSEGALRLLDQRLLPAKEEWLKLTTWEEVSQAIRDMAVRGAPAIGVAAAYGMALAAQAGASKEKALMGLAASRPTAVNLFWALDRIQVLPSFDFESVIAEARTIELEDLQCNLAIGHNGNDLLPDPAKVLTICNTGSIATAGHGTALGILRTAHYEGKRLFVYACETRPRMQGLKLTAWELQRESIPFKVIADGAAASLMKSAQIDCVIAGADRIAANGDTANKIGTYALAVLARYHDIPFYIAAPTSTIDSSIRSGEQIPIEERASEEITHIGSTKIGPDGCEVFNPAFDVTPGDLITAIVTDEGVFKPPYSFNKPASASRLEPEGTLTAH